MLLVEFIQHDFLCELVEGLLAFEALPVENRPERILDFQLGRFEFLEQVAAAEGAGNGVFEADFHGVARSSESSRADLPKRREPRMCQTYRTVFTNHFGVVP